MTQPPRRLPPTHEERVKVTIDRMAGGSDGGSTRFARPVPGLSAASSRSIPPLKGDQAYVPLGYSSEGAVPAGAVPSGATARVDGERAVANGPDAGAGESGTAVGDGSSASGLRSVAIGWGAAVGGSGLVGDYATAVGPGSRCAFDGSTAIGKDANVSYALDIVLGTDLNTVQINTPLPTAAGAASGKYLPIRCEDGVIRLLPLYNLP